MSEQRPDPDALLRRVKRDEAEAKHGRLKVFFGAAPGVGKTYAMLEAARRQARRGRGRRDRLGRDPPPRRDRGARRGPRAAAAARGRAPRRPARASSTSTRRSRASPACCCSTSSPTPTRRARATRSAGRTSRELLDAGIDVWTTLNVQHLESVNDLVERITGVVVRETLPDHLLDEADEVEFVDLPPEDLLRRLDEGKVYLPEQAARAVQAVLPQGQPDGAARAGAAAHRRARGRRRAGLPARPRDRGHLAGRPSACSSAIRPNPDSGRLVRAARRLAARLRAEWIAAWSRAPASPPLSPPPSAATSPPRSSSPSSSAPRPRPSRAERPRGRARSFARERNVSKIVVGKPAPRAGATAARLAGGRASSEPAATSTSSSSPGETDGGAAARSGQGSPRREPGHYVWSAAVVARCARSSPGRCSAASTRSNLVMVYLLGVAFVATRYGRGPSALAAIRASPCSTSSSCPRASPSWSPTPSTSSRSR